VFVLVFEAGRSIQSARPSASYRICCHCSESSSPIRHPVVSAATINDRRCGFAGASKRSSSPGLRRRVRETSAPVSSFTTETPARLNGVPVSEALADRPVEEMPQSPEQPIAANDSVRTSSRPDRFQVGLGHTGYRFLLEPDGPSVGGRHVARADHPELVLDLPSRLHPQMLADIGHEIAIHHIADRQRGRRRGHGSFRIEPGSDLALSFYSNENRVHDVRLHAVTYGLSFRSACRNKTSAPGTSSATIA
jgi:hypothetical protein